LLFTFVPLSIVNAPAPLLIVIPPAPRLRLEPPPVASPVIVRAPELLTVMLLAEIVVFFLIVTLKAPVPIPVAEKVASDPLVQAAWLPPLTVGLQFRLVVSQVPLGPPVVGFQNGSDGVVVVGVVVVVVVVVGASVVVAVGVVVVVATVGVVVVVAGVVFVVIAVVVFV
jgi:hypothetical protein